MEAAYVQPVYRSRVFKRDRYECQLCGQPMDMSVTAPQPFAPTIDHIIPIARGGTHEPANVQSAHFICNSRKRDALEPAILATNTLANAA